MNEKGSHPLAELSAWVDDELDAPTRAEVEAHLAICASCAIVAADLGELASRASSLEDRAPVGDLWPRIRDHLDAHPRARVIPIETARGRVSLSWTQLAAAAVALILLAGGTVWLVLSGREAIPGAGPSAVADRGTADDSAEAELAADFAAESYEAAVADLEAALQASRDQLDPGTVTTIERNLAIIDQAIAETRTALAADPNSIYLSAHLAEQMRRKLDVLRVATTTVSNASL
jgi:anti-sigma factor RsiW